MPYAAFSSLRLCRAVGHATHGCVAFFTLIGATWLHGQSLGDALDNNSYVWSTSGDASWSGQSFVSYDGVDAARSGVIGNAQNSLLQTTITGPATIAFWWKVSSEAGFDYLNFKLNGAVLNSISGQTDWALVTATLPAGSNTLQWIYEKDEVASNGDDAGWVDRVVVSTGGMLGVSVSSLQYLATQTLSTNPLAKSFQVWNAGTGSLAITLASNAAWLIPATTSFTSTGPGNPTTVTANLNWSTLAPGDYSATITISGAAANSSVVIPVKVTVAVPLATALDTTGTNALVWSTELDGEWYGQNTETHDSVDAARSPRISHGQEARLRTTVQDSNEGKGILRFWWRASSETGKDTLDFEIDQQLMDSISGDTGWQQKKYYILDTAQHTADWYFTKDASDSGPIFNDAGYVDEVNWVTDVREMKLPVMPGGTVGKSPDVPLFESGESVSISASPNASYTFAGWYDFFANTMGPSSPRTITFADKSRRSYALFGQSFSSSTVDAASNTFFSWLTGGNTPWLGQSTISQDGISALQSGDVADDQISWFQSQVSGPGTLSFYWKVSSESGYDFLSFHVDDAVMAAISGDTGWQLVSFPIDTGTHRLTWVYAKDNSFSLGEDMAWVDRIMWPGTTTFPTWQATYFSPTELADATISGLLADPSKSGFNNLTRHAFNMTRTQSSSNNLPVAGQYTEGSGEAINRYATLVFTIRNDDPQLSFRVEASSDLVNWSYNGDASGIPHIALTSTDNSNGTRTVTARDLTPFTDAIRRYLRVRLIYP